MHSIFISLGIFLFRSKVLKHVKLRVAYLAPGLLGYVRGPKRSCYARNFHEPSQVLLNKAGTCELYI